ncbi:MAG: hypothetical protein WAV11_03565 [Minisyncoccia bacterium]
MDNENDSDKFILNPHLRSNHTTGITAWFIKNGWVKDQKSAEVLMIVISIVCFAVAIYFTIK